MAYEQMTRDQFLIQIEKLLNFFGNSKVNKHFIERIWSHVSNLPYNNFIRIVDNVLDGSRHLPTPKEFADLARLERQSLRMPLEDEPTVIDCEHCGDTGFTWVNSFYDHPVWMFCNCDVGKKRVKERSFKLMMYMPQLNIKHREFPTSYFVPPKIKMDHLSDEQISLIQFNFVQNRMNDFKKDLLESEKYWMNLKTKNSEGA